MKIHSTRFLEKFVIFILFWLLFYDVNLPGLGGFSIIIFLFLFLALFPTDFIKAVFRKYNVNLIFIILLFYSYVLIRSVFGEIDFLLIFSKVSLVIIGASIFTFAVVERHGERVYVHIFFAVIFMQALSPYFYLFSDLYKDSVILFQYPDILDRDIHSRGALSLRKSFLSGSGGFFGMAIGLGLALYFSTWFFVNGYINRYIYIIYFFFVSAAALIAGRSAVMFIAASVLIIAFSLKPWKKVILSFIVLMLAPIIFILIKAYVGDMAEMGREYVLLSWMLDPILNLVESSKFKTESTSILKEMYFIPSIEDILYGSGKYYTDDGRYFGGSDVGYIRQILFGGFLIILISVIYLIYLAKDMKGIFKIIFILLLLMAHAKGNILFGSPTAMSICASFAAFAYLHYNNIRKLT